MSNVHNLSFADITLLEPSIAEVIAYEGVEIDMDMVREFHNFLLSHLQAPFALLVNKKNSYSYSFEAQLSVALLKEIKAIAVVAYSDGSTSVAKSLKDMPNHTEWEMETFTDYDEALAWIKEQLATD